MAKRHEAAKRAASFIGTMEQPPGSNRGQRVSAWIKRAAGVDGGIPWCACFVWCMFDDVGRRVKIRYPASVLSWVETAQANGWTRKRPWRGHAVAFSWSGHDPSPDDHIGFVERVLALPRRRKGSGLSWHYYIRTVEGNTGDGVYRRWRWVHPLDVCFIEVPDL